MVYKSASQKILIWLFIITFSITVISGSDYWKMWSILPMTFFMLWLAGKFKGYTKDIGVFPDVVDTTYIWDINPTMFIDVMFMDDKAYKYEPIYDNWREANAPNYWHQNTLIVIYVSLNVIILFHS